jgi:CheY-like chemotaxis protein
MAGRERRQPRDIRASRGAVGRRRYNHSTGWGGDVAPGRRRDLGKSLGIWGIAIAAGVALELLEVHRFRASHRTAPPLSGRPPGPRRDLPLEVRLLTLPEAPVGTIFVAEDNPILLQGLSRALEAYGYRVVSAASGDEILERLRQAPGVADLILLDVMMPGLSGMEVLRAVKEDPSLREVPTVLVSAGADEALAVTALRGGAEDVMMKPFRLRELIVRIEGHIRRHRELRSLRKELALQRSGEAPVPRPAAR